LTNGYYNEIGIDLFETLSEPPVGNISSLKYARDVLNKNICTRGNLGLDILLNGTQDDVVKATQNIIESTKSTKHIVAASDYLFYDIPLENVKAMAGTVKSLNLSI
jgi:uroporphyrinogen-III decarboxylase